MSQNYRETPDDENLDVLNLEDAWWGMLSAREDRAEHELELLRAWG